MSEWKSYHVPDVVRAAPIEHIWREYETDRVVSAEVAGRYDWVPDHIETLEYVDPGDYAIECADGSKAVWPKAKFDALYVEVQS